MVEVSITLNGTKIVAKCRSGLEEQAKSMLSTFEPFRHKPPGLTSGTTVQFGWSVLTLKGRGARLRVYEPDFDGDPFTDVRDDVSTTLEVAAEQVKLVRAVGARGDPPLFSEKVVLAKRVLKRVHIYAERIATGSPNDSGWYVGPVTKAEPKKLEPKDLEASWVYNFLEDRRELMQILALPPGYLVVFDGSEVDSISDPSGATVFRGGNE